MNDSANRYAFRMVATRPSGFAYRLVCLCLIWLGSSLVAPGMSSNCGRDRPPPATADLAVRAAIAVAHSSFGNGAAIVFAITASTICLAGAWCRFGRLVWLPAAIVAAYLTLDMTAYSILAQQFPASRLRLGDYSIDTGRGLDWTRIMIAALVAGLATLALAIDEHFRWRPIAPPGICPVCGYDLRHNPTGVCPECGGVSAEEA